MTNYDNFLLSHLAEIFFVSYAGAKEFEGFFIYDFQGLNAQLISHFFNNKQGRSC